MSETLEQSVGDLHARHAILTNKLKRMERKLDKIGGLCIFMGVMTIINTGILIIAMTVLATLRFPT